MDIQELEQFEDWFATRYPNVQKTIDLHNDHESIVFRNNQAEAWQAAKAQAVPEGFVIVPRDPTDEMWSSGIDVYANAMESNKTMPAISIIDIYKAMLAASQEPK